MAEEIDRLDQRIDQVTDQTLDATRRILRTAEETNVIGVDTLVTLNEQGEKLDNVERRLDEINVDLKKTDKNLTEIEKCCGCFSCNCRRSYQVGVTSKRKGSDLRVRERSQLHMYLVKHSNPLWKNVK